MGLPALQIRSLCAGYGAHQVLADIELAVACGEWFALLGPNGSGKTTLLQCIGGQLTPTAGSVLIGGEALAAEPRRARRLLGYAHAPERLPGLLTGRQCLSVYAAAWDLQEVPEDVMALAERLGLTGWLDRFVDSYSLGTRQKLAVTLALVGDPKLVVLDEAFNGLDPASALVVRRELQQRVQARRCAVVLATHALDLVLRHATRAALLLEGRLVHTWDAQQLQAMRTGSPEALESALAEAAAGAVA